MLYVIDTESFNGYIVAKMDDNKYINFTALKLETYKKNRGLPGLKAVTAEEFERMREEYIYSREKDFQIINEEEFYIRINEGICKRHFLSKEFVLFYLTSGEDIAFNIYPLYVRYKDKYYASQKHIGLSIDDMLCYIKKRKTLHVFNLEDAGHSVALFNYMERQGISDVADLFDTQPDKLRLKGSDIYFTRIEDQYDRYVIYSDTAYKVNGEEVEQLLLRFFSDNYQSFFDRKYSQWNQYTEKCIAFRDGKGTKYAIWEYKY